MLKRLGFRERRRMTHGFEVRITREVATVPGEIRNES